MTAASVARHRVSGRGWAYTGAVLGGLMSIAANVAHSYVPPPDAAPGWSPPAGAVVGAIFWPVALFVAVEIFARTAWPAGRRWTALRFLGLLPVALVAAVVSYRHLSGLLTFYREDPLTATIGPLAVDGLMVMATAALIATATRRTVAAVAETVVTQQSRVQASPADATLPAPAAVETSPPVEAQPSPATPTEDPTPASVPVAKPAGRPARPRTSRRPPSADKVAKAATRMPGATVAQIAAKAGVSESTARRYMPAAADATVTPANPASPAPMPALADAA